MMSSRNVKRFAGIGKHGLLLLGGLLCMDGLKDHQDQPSKPKFQLEGNFFVFNLLISIDVYNNAN